MCETLHMCACVSLCMCVCVLQHHHLCLNHSKENLFKRTQNNPGTLKEVGMGEKERGREERREGHLRRNLLFLFFFPFSFLYFFLTNLVGQDTLKILKLIKLVASHQVKEWTKRRVKTSQVRKVDQLTSVVIFS